MCCQGYVAGGSLVSARSSRAAACCTALPGTALLMSVPAKAVQACNLQSLVTCKGLKREKAPELNALDYLERTHALTSS